MSNPLNTHITLILRLFSMVILLGLPQIAVSQPCQEHQVHVSDTTIVLASGTELSDRGLVSVSKSGHQYCCDESACSELECSINCSTNLSPNPIPELSPIESSILRTPKYWVHFPSGYIEHLLRPPIYKT